MLVKDEFFQCKEKLLMGCIGSDREGGADVFQIVILAGLELGTREHPCQRWFHRSIVIGNHDAHRVLHPFEYPKELLICQLVFGGSEQTANDVMREIVEGEDEGYFLRVTADLDVFGIDNEDPAEAGAEVFSELVGVGELVELGDNASVGLGG